ncbi:MAG: porin family protein [Alphaproteobacteria bacterium]|nr:porin family protein [Alphaproteobacteria bacterium SS10]
MTRFISRPARQAFSLATALLSLTFLAAPEQAQAEEFAWSQDRFYIAGRAMLGFHDNDTPRITGITDPGIVDETSDSVIVGGQIAIGYTLSETLPIRLEADYTYRFRHDVDTRAFGPEQIYNADVESHTGSIAAYYDFTLHEFETASPLKLSVGGGFGFAQHEIDGLFIFPTGGILEENSRDETSFIWHLSAGINFPIYKGLTGDLIYRYSDLGEIETAAFASGAVLEADDFISHDIFIGLRYNF